MPRCLQVAANDHNSFHSLLLLLLLPLLLLLLLAAEVSAIASNACRATFALTDTIKSTAPKEEGLW